MQNQNLDRGVALALSKFSKGGSKKRYITVDNVYNYFLPQEIEQIKQEYITSNHGYNNFGAFLTQKYGFHPVQVKKGKFIHLFGYAQELNELRKQFLIRETGAKLVREELKEVAKEIEVLEEKKTDGRKEFHKKKARDAKEALLNAIYELAKRLDQKLQSGNFMEIEMFLIQNIRNVREVLEMLAAIEQEGDWNVLKEEITVKPKLVLNKNQIMAQSINFQTIKPEEIVTPKDLVNFSGSNIEEDSLKEKEEENGEEN